jgi:hypothetical protein
VVGFTNGSRREVPEGTSMIREDADCYHNDYYHYEDNGCYYYYYNEYDYYNDN